MAGTLWAQESGDESVSGILGYGEKTVEVSTAQDLVDAVDQKHDITVLLKGDVAFADLVWQNDYTRLVYRTPPVPEPATGVLCLAALLPLVLLLRRR